MSDIPIVQGVAVSDAAYSKAPSYPQTATTTTYAAVAASGEEQQQQLTPRKQYQDVIWAVAFWAHLLVIIILIGIGLQSQGGGGGASNYSGALVLVGVTGGTAVGLSCTALSFMMQHTEMLVQTALIFSVTSSLAVGVVGFVVGSTWMGILGLVSFAIGICYAKIVWPRIPYAAANLQTAVTAVQANLGLVVVALGFTGLAFAWTLLWFMGLGDALEGSKLPVVFLLVRFFLQNLFDFCRERRVPCDLAVALRERTLGAKELTQSFWLIRFTLPAQHLTYSIYISSS